MIHKLISSQYRIGATRIEELNRLANLIAGQFHDSGEVNLLFVCTHNSRRSQLAEFWMDYFLSRLEFKKINSFSAGTESTAFNHRMIAAIDRFGFKMVKEGPEDNPKYVFQDLRKKPFFSKTVDHDEIPNSHLIAIMVCDHADKNCPFIPGAQSRFSLRYVDPKAHDGSDKEQEGYDNKVMEIGLEMFYLSEFLNDILSAK